jgi:hypothetical protein
MPSQRLLKILDPLGHVRRQAAPDGTTAVIWAPSSALATLLRNRLAAAEIYPLFATSFRHIASSVMAGAKPYADLVILDFDSTSATNLSTLASMRWAGFRGPIVAISQAGVIDSTARELYQIEAVFPRRRVAAELTAYLAKLPRSH